MKTIARIIQFLILTVLLLALAGCSMYVTPTHSRFIQCDDDQRTAFYLAPKIIHVYVDVPTQANSYQPSIIPTRFNNWAQSDYICVTRDSVINAATKTRYYFKVSRDTIFFGNQKLPVRKTF